MVGGDLDHKPELPILLDLLAEPTRAGARLRRWVRTDGPKGRPIDLLHARDFAAFEDALATSRERGFVMRVRRLAAAAPLSGSGRFSPGQWPVRWCQPIAP